jgi:16S rRNA (uracil1498-N3)-methyltransferase
VIAYYIMVGKAPWKLCSIVLFFLANKRCDAFSSARRTGDLRSLQASVKGDNDDLGHAMSGYHTLPRLFVGDSVSSLPLTLNARIPLTQDQAHYCTKVMRMGRKDKGNLLRIFDGVSGEWLAELVEGPSDAVYSTNKGRRRRDETDILMVQCVQQLRSQEADEASFNRPWLFFAPIKKSRAKMLLEKCTELGVGRLTPILAERCDPVAIRHCTTNFDKLKLQLVEASEQCERMTVPELSLNVPSALSPHAEPLDLKRLLELWSSISEEGRHLLVCRERSVRNCEPMLQILRRLHSKTDRMPLVAFLVGPEGGWSAGEQDLLDEREVASDCIHSVSLGDLVLRAETAAMTAVGSFMLFQDELK